jgi:hypothetical protein
MRQTNTLLNAMFQQRRPWNDRDFVHSTGVNYSRFIVCRRREMFVALHGLHRTCTGSYEARFRCVYRLRKDKINCCATRHHCIVFH